MQILSNATLRVSDDWSKVDPASYLTGLIVEVNTTIRSWVIMPLGQLNWHLSCNDSPSIISDGLLGEVLEAHIKPKLWATEKEITINIERKPSPVQERLMSVLRGASIEKMGLRIRQAEEGQGIPFYTVLLEMGNGGIERFATQWCIYLTKSHSEKWLSEQRQQKWERWQQAVAKGGTVWMSTRKGTAGDYFPSGTLFSKDSKAYAILPDGSKLVVKVVGYGASQEAYFEKTGEVIDLDSIDILRYRILTSK